MADIEFRFSRQHWWTQGCNLKVHDAQGRERYRVNQRFTLGLKLEVFDDSEVLKARIRQHTALGFRFEVSLFDHAANPRLALTLRQHFWPSEWNDSVFPNGERIVAKGQGDSRTVRYGNTTLELTMFGALSEEEQRQANARLIGHDVDDEVLAIALVVPFIATRPSD